MSARTAAVQDLTDNRVVIAGSGGELEDSGNLTFDGSTLTVSGDLETNVSIGGTNWCATFLRCYCFWHVTSDAGVANSFIFDGTANIDSLLLNSDLTDSGRVEVLNGGEM